MTPSPFLDVAHRDGRVLVETAAADWRRPVPQCPDWDGAGLIRHTGAVLAWIEAVVSGGRGRLSRRGMATAPTDDGQLVAWYMRQLDRALGTLSSADGDAPVWTFSGVGEHRVEWWKRRVAVELAIHRWDAQHAHAVGAAGPAPQSLDPSVAEAGLHEFVTEFLPGLLEQAQTSDLHGVIDLRAVDATQHWRLDLDSSDARRVSESGTAPDTGSVTRANHTSVAGTRSQLLLWLTNRCPIEELTTHGDLGVLRAWRRLRR
jgi:uncharacterized protein (TIGR03083 family)